MTTLVPRRAWTLAISDTAVMTRRYLCHYLRKPSLLAVALVQPVLFVLLWTYVFSGAIQTPGGITYVDYLMPGLFILAIAFGLANTGVGLADDLGRGLIDRFRALALGGPTSGPLLRAIAWIVGILAVVIPLAIHRYRRVTQ